jgi:nucleolar protein 56
MSAVDYLLHESSVGYAIFQVVHQADTIGMILFELLVFQILDYAC